MSCTFFNSNDKYIEKAYHDNGKIKYEIHKKNDMVHGFAKYWDENGIIINEVQYFNGAFHGLWKEYYKNGNLKYSISYKYGLKDGYEYWFYENEQKQSETLYIKGEKQFDTIRWNKDGDLIYR